MTNFFLSLYRFFKSHKALYYVIVIGTTLCFGYFAMQIRFEENIISLLPKTEKSDDCAVAFGNIKVKDKVFIELHARDGQEMSSADLAEAMDGFLDQLKERDAKGLIGNVLYRFDADDVMNLVYYGMDALPCHLGEWFYEGLDTLLVEKKIDAYATGKAPAPIPENMSSYAIIQEHLFSPDGSVALAFMSPSFSTYDTLLGGDLEKLMSGTINDFVKANPDCEILYHGAVIEGSFNSRQIKKDLIWSLGISLLLICLLISICFKSKGTLFHLLTPVLYGTLFSLAVIYWIKGEVSLMAMGIGAIVLGVALSYCLHVLVHHKFITDVEQVIREQAKPVCLGCLTTIGAFAGLLFTSSSLLKDFGIFASLAMVGTTFFALAFLPQLFSENGSLKNEKAFEVISKVNSYPLHRNIPVVIALVIISIVCICFSGKVKFDNDLNNIGYKEPKMLRSIALYNEKVNEGHLCMYYAAHSGDLDSAIVFNRAMGRVLDSLRNEGKIISYSGPEGILVPEEEQWENIQRWKDYWTPARTQSAYRLLKKEAKKYNWNTGGIDIAETFKIMAEADFEPVSLYDYGALPEALLCNYVENNDDGWLVMSSVLMDPENLGLVNDAIASQPGLIVLDPFYYTGDMVEIVHDDFSIVLLISSIFVLLVLLLSFKSLTVSIIAFLPMFLSWYILQGMMAIFGIQFNLINIMISTFVFGIGVDYSIFVTEGLLSAARGESERLLVCHKAAITFSALILIVVTGSLLFATHPATYSVGVSTIIGMTSTILITYTLQPLLFNLAMKSDFLRRKALHVK